MSNIFNLSKDLKQPTIYLCKKNYARIGDITNYISNVDTSYNFNNADEVSFTVHKEINGKLNQYWDDIANLKVIYVYDYDKYYEIEVDERTSSEKTKQIIATSLCESELSQLNITVEVNTDIDISRDDYVPTIVYNPYNPSASLLNRILKDKAPHYKILHVDSSLANLQRTFSIDTNIDDFLRQELSAEIDAFVEYDTTKRGISLYDMLSVCSGCGYRGNFYDVCPECNSKNVKNGYGEWTNVYVSKDNLADEITLTADKSTIKNSFKIIGGDDKITNAIPSVNPNGSGYIVKFSDLQYSDMPDELVDKLKSYDELLNSKKTEFKELNLNICNCIDKILYYESEMMPSPETFDTDATKELKKVIDNLNALMASAEPPNSIGIDNFGVTTTATIVDRAVLSYVKIMMSPDYEISILSSVYKDGIWKGKFHVNSISYPDDDYADSSVDMELRVDGNEIAYVEQKIQKSLATKDLKDKTYDFTLYGVKSLENFRDAYLSCMTILQEHGDSTKPEDSIQYQIYKKYYDLYYEVESELLRRNITVQEWKDLMYVYETQKKEINDLLDLQLYLGEDLFKVYCSYRRDDKYENSNYISDGLTDSEILEMAEKLIEVANKDLSVACQNQYTLTASVNNLFLIPEFEPFHNKCRLGNWIYIEINDVVYSLRLIKIGINYDSIDKITIEFSNVIKVHSISKDISDILNDAKSMSSSYPSTVKQVSDDSKIVSQVNQWVDNGLDATNVMITNAPNQNTVITENGILCRSLDEITGNYNPTQMRIINSTISITDDDWLHTKTAFGKYIYQDPLTSEYKYAYGLIGETIVGKLLLGENLGIYNNTQSLTFDSDGLKITNSKNTFIVNPNNSELLSLSNSNGKVLYVDENGILHIQGDGAGLDISLNNSITGLSNKMSITTEGLEQKISSVDGRVTALSSTVDGLKTEVSDKVSNSTFTQKSNEIDVSIKTKVGNNEVIAKINASTEGIQILGNKVNITGLVTFNSFSSDLQNSINTISGNASDAKSKTDGLATGTTIINGGCIQTNTIDANKIVSGSLIVGDNVTMGSNATISWGQVTNKSSVLTENDNITRLNNNAGYTTMSVIEGKGYQTASQVTQITKDTVTTSYINALNVKAGSVDAENITGTTISGKTINGCAINGTTFSGCSGDFTSIFLYNKDNVGTFQHGSICGQYVNSDGTMTQTEVIRINNMKNNADMFIYKPMYFYNSDAYPIFNPDSGIIFGSRFIGDIIELPAYINTLYTKQKYGTAAIRLGFSDYNYSSSGEVPAFEIYDNYNVNESTHTISAKVFGNLTVDGTVANQSSIRYKTNVQPLSETTALNLLDYEIVSFDYIAGSKGKHGMIAEQAVKVSEYGIIKNSDNEPDAIGYIDFIPDIIKMIQIMYREIDVLKQEINNLKST